MKCEGGGGGGGGGGELGSDLPRSGSESMENIMDPNLAKLMRIADPLNLDPEYWFYSALSDITRRRDPLCINC